MAMRQSQLTENRKTYSTARSFRSKSLLAKGLLSAAPLAGAFGLFIIAAWIGLNRGSVPAHIKTTTYTVKAGDTEWSIAERFDDTDNTQAVVHWIEQHNRISGDLQPGQILTVPVGR
ncbi:hypothetical protein GCM10025859_51690 [Alicyclobacillus fastidiosus]|nr:hypothetical protein GCM10025859_51690 [Alicyclobacillus fastidiosus]